MGSFNSTTRTSSNSSNNAFIDDVISKHDIVIFSRTNCGYCTMAKSELEKLNLNYHSIELDVSSNCPQEDCASLVQVLIAQTRMRTVPQIFFKGRLIGGYTELTKLIKEGKLKP